MTNLSLRSLVFNCKTQVSIATFIFWAAFCPNSFSQSGEPRPVARLVTSTVSVSRPRRVSSTSYNAGIATTSNPSLDQANPVERRAFDQTNVVRVQNGLPPLTWDAELCRIARNHSNNMARTGFFSHITPDGDRLRDRARAAGILHFSVLGENIAYNLGYDDPGAFAVERWMMSPGHRANILSPQFHAMAIGTSVAADGGVYLTQVFIAR